MTGTKQLNALAVVAAMALCLLALVVVQPVEAAYPGANGKIAFQSNRDASGEIYTTNAGGGTAARITFPAGGNVEPAYSPDGSRIAFNKSGDVHIMNAGGMKLDGTGSRRLTSMSSLESDPTWSPDGTRIAFLANTFALDGQTDLEIWMINADGTGQKPLTENGFTERDPAWSPQGDRIAFVSERRPAPFNDTDSNVYVMDANGNSQTNITPNISDPENPYQGYDEDPAWSPDGTRIAYVHGRTGAGGDGRDIWAMDPNGANKGNISDDAEPPNTPVSETDNLTSESEPAWSPSGDRIAYVLVRAGDTNQDIAVMDAAGTNEAAIDTGDDTRTDAKPDWQPIPQCTATVNAANNPLTGTAGKDVLCGDARDNTINGGGGDDVVLAQGGNDRLTGALGNDTLNGGAGVDTVLYTGPTAVAANLTTEFATGTGMDVLLGIENLGGSNANDRFTGNVGRNVLSGFGGNDLLTTRDGIGGNDTIDGGTGTADTCRRDVGDTIRNCP